MSETIPDILEEMREELHALRSEVEALRRQQAPDGPKALYSREEAAELLGVSTSTLDDIRAMGEIKATKVNGRVNYHPKTLKAYMREHTN